MHHICMYAVVLSCCYYVMLNKVLFPPSTCLSVILIKYWLNVNLLLKLKAVMLLTFMFLK